MARAVPVFLNNLFEVAADPLSAPDLPADCTDCQLATLLAFKTIYTRSPKEKER